MELEYYDIDGKAMHIDDAIIQFNQRFPNAKIHRVIYKGKTLVNYTDRHFCGFCRKFYDGSICPNEHYISPSTIGY